MSKILVVEDEASLAEEIREWLQHEKYIVETVQDGLEARHLLSVFAYDAIVLDWMLPGLSGLEVCRQYRRDGGTTPILILTARTAIESKEAGLDSGADDYLTKPFHLKELSARLRSLLRRGALICQPVLRLGEIVLDPRARTVVKGGVKVHLEPREFNLLEFLIRHPNTPFSPEALIERVWQSGSGASAETLRSYIKSLRKKLDSPGQDSLITTVHGCGYKVQTS